MALKKPSELFNKNKSNPFEEIKEEHAAAQISNIDDAFESFQLNVNHIQSLNDFTKTFGTFSENVERIQDISEEIVDIKEDINSLVKKEDLDDAMVSQLLYVKDTIAKVEEGIETLNTKSIYKIKNDFSSLSEKVNTFINVETPKYKKDLLRSENRVDSNIEKLKEYLVSESEEINSKVDQRIDSIKEEVNGINSGSLDAIREEIASISEGLEDVIKKDIPQYKTFFAETELKTEKSLSSFNEEFRSKIESFEKEIGDRVNNLNELIDEELPKYNNLIIEGKFDSENKINELKSNLEKVSEQFQKGFEESSEKVDEKLINLQTLLDESKVTVDDLSYSYESLYKDFKNREIHSDKKLQSYENNITEVKENITEFKENITKFKESVGSDINTISNDLKEKVSDYRSELVSEVGSFKDTVSSKIDDLEVDIVRNEQHIKSQNDHIEQITESVRETIESLKVNELERKNKQLTKKILYIEKVLEEFNEKKLLTEGLLNEPTTADNSDPLTPLDKNYATLDDLQNHYKIFINRIQQQLSTLGGGGETQLQYLDDIVGVATNLSAYDGMYLQVDTSAADGKKFKFSEVSSGGVGAAGTWRVDSSGISTSKNIGIGTTSVSDTALIVEGDAWFSGNLAVGGTVTHNDVQNLESIGIVTAQTGIRVIAGGIDVSAGIVTIPSTIVGAAVTTDSQGIRAAGVVTATSFVGDGSSLTGIDATAIQTGTTKVQTSTPGISNEVGGLGIGTFSGAGLNVTGVVTATSFVGDGSSLTNIASRTVTSSTVAGVTTDTFTISGGYNVGYLDVYLNGARLIINDDFTATNGSTVNLITAADTLDIVEFVSYQAFNVSNVTTAGGDFSVGDELSVVGHTTAKTAYYTGIVTATSFTGDGSNLTGIDATAVQTGTTKVQTSTPGISNEVGGLGIGTFSGAGLNVTGIVTATSFTAAESVDIAGGATVTGLSTFTGNVDINSDVDINRSLAVTGGSTVTGLSTFTGNVDINSDVDINRSLSVTGGTTVSGIVTATTFTGDGSALTGLPQGSTITDERDGWLFF